MAMQSGQEHHTLKLNYSSETLTKGLGFEFQKGDIVCASYPKSGTTWCQQIVHQLRSKGDMNFTDINKVVPFIDAASDLGVDLKSDQAELFAPPRTFKTHFSWEWIPKTLSKSDELNAHYLYITRDPHDVACSAYEYFSDVIFSSDEISPSKYVEIWSTPSHSHPARKAGPIPHVASWYRAAQLYPKNILFLFYEDVQDDLAGAVRKIGNFVGLNDREDFEERIKIATDQSSFSFMKKYNDVYNKECSPIKKHYSFINKDRTNKGVMGRGRSFFGDEISKKLDGIIQTHFNKEFGNHINTYADFRNLAKTNPTLNLFLPCNGNYEKN